MNIGSSGLEELRKERPGLTLLFFLSGFISPTLYMLPLGIAVALIGTSVFLERKKWESKIGRAFIYPTDEDL